MQCFIPEETQGPSEPLKIKDLSIGLHQDIRRCVHGASCVAGRAEEQVVTLDPDLSDI